MVQQLHKLILVTATGLALSGNLRAAPQAEEDEVNPISLENSVWILEQEKLAKEIEQAKARLNLLVQAYERREEWRKAAQSDKATLQADPPDETVHPAPAAEVERQNDIPAQNPERVPPARQRVDLEFVDATWQTVLDELAGQTLTLNLKDYPNGTLTLTGYRQIPLVTAIEILNGQLIEHGYELWLSGSALHLVQHLSNRHPLIGSWSLTKAINNGRNHEEDLDKYSIIISNQTMWIYRGDQLESRSRFAAGEEECWALWSEGFAAQGSFKIDGDQAVVLLQQPGDSVTGEVNPGMLFLKLQRKAKNTN